MSILAQNANTSKSTAIAAYDAAILAKLRANDPTITRAALAQMKSDYWRGIATALLGTPIEAREQVIAEALREQEDMVYTMAQIAVDAPLPPTDIPDVDYIEFAWADELPDVAEEWLLPGILPANASAVLAGDSQAYKTFLSLDLALCIATGLDWHGRKVKQGPVVYVPGEGQNGIKKRIDAWRKHHHISGHIPLAVASKMPAMLDAASAARLYATCRKVQELEGAPPVLVVIDTLSKAMAGMGDENQQKDMQALLAATAPMQQEFGATVLHLHHRARAGNIRGSIALQCDVDVVLEMARTAPDKPFTTLSCFKLKDEESFVPLLFKAHKVLLDEEAAQSSLVLDLADANEIAEGDSHTICLSALQACIPADVALEGWEGAANRDWKEAAKNAGIPYGSFDRLLREVKRFNWVTQEEGTRRYRYTRAGVQHLKLAGKWFDPDAEAPDPKITPITSKASEGKQ